MEPLANNPVIVNLGAPPGTTRELVFLCSDVVDFTGLTERLGDLEAFRTMSAVNAAIRTRMTSFGGTEWELRGDGFLFTFPSVELALAAAVATQADRSAACENCPERCVRLRMALHAGSACVAGPQLFGLNVILAFRLVDIGDPDEIAVSAQACAPLACQWRRYFSSPLGARLKGFNRTVIYTYADWRAMNGNQARATSPARSMPDEAERAAAP